MNTDTTTVATDFAIVEELRTQAHRLRVRYADIMLLHRPAAIDAAELLEQRADEIEQLALRKY